MSSEYGEASGLARNLFYGGKNKDYSTTDHAFDSDDNVDDPNFVLTTESDCDNENNCDNRDECNDIRRADYNSDSSQCNGGASGEANSESSERKTPKHVQ